MAPKPDTAKRDDKGCDPRFHSASLASPSAGNGFREGAWRDGAASAMRGLQSTSGGQEWTSRLIPSHGATHSKCFRLRVSVATA